MIWAACISEWWLLLALTVFCATHFIKFKMMRRRNSMARWLAVLSYSFVFLFSGELLVHGRLEGLSEGMFGFIHYWTFFFGVGYLLCFDFSTQMREAPNIKQ
jgi:hypothetical protein